MSNRERENMLLWAQWIVVSMILCLVSISHDEFCALLLTVEQMCLYTSRCIHSWNIFMLLCLWWSNSNGVIVNEDAVSQEECLLKPPVPWMINRKWKSMPSPHHILNSWCSNWSSKIRPPFSPEAMLTNITALWLELAAPWYLRSFPASASTPLGHFCLLQPFTT